LHQNQSLRYATHQLKMPMGMVASSDHMMGKVKSAISPSTTKDVQKTLRCIPLYSNARDRSAAVCAGTDFEKEHVLQTACRGLRLLLFYDGNGDQKDKT
jgi:hypothetical protein